MVSEDRPRLLALRALGLGDFLTGIPALRALRRGFPGHALILAAPAALTPLVRRSGTADRTVDVGELEPVPWQGDPPDVAVDLHGKGAASHRLLSALEPRRLICFADPHGGYPDRPRWRPDEHEVRRWCRLLEEEGIPADPDDLDLDPAPGSDAAADETSDSEARILIHPGAAAASRRWGADRFAYVAGALAAQGHRVAVTAGPHEYDLAAEVARRAGLGTDCTDGEIGDRVDGGFGDHIVGGFDLYGLADLVAGARLVLCGDTGVAHLATAVRTPSVVLFGPVPPAEWGPPPRARHIALWHGEPGYRGDPHGLVIDPALHDIKPDEVLDAARRLLAAAPRRAAYPGA